MTTISAEVVADSVSEAGVRLTTMVLKYPRWIHAEERTHRLLSTGEEWPTPSVMADPNLSRNASSSRAIPVSRMIQDVLDDPAVPLFWGSNVPGMQSGEECNERVVVYGWGGGFDRTREAAWLLAMTNAVNAAKCFADAGYHKQIVNRLLEPFSHISVVVTATEWDNFFALRRHAAAEPHMRLLADRMWDAMTASRPEPLDIGEWHTPFVTDEEYEERGAAVAVKCSVARCARVSFLNHDGTAPSVEKDLELYERLVGSEPLHASPAEHQGRPDLMVYDTYGTGEWSEGYYHGNFRGWVQNRKTLPGG